MKPDPQLPRNKTILARIDQHLAAGLAPDKSYLYEFDEPFAELHPQDAPAILAYNLRQTAGRLRAVPEVSAAAGGPRGWRHPAAPWQRLPARNCRRPWHTETLVAHDYDNAFPTLIRELLPIGNGIKGFVLAAIFGAVVSSHRRHAQLGVDHRLDRHLSQVAERGAPVRIGLGRPICVVLFVLIAIGIAPFLGIRRSAGSSPSSRSSRASSRPGSWPSSCSACWSRGLRGAVGTVGLVLNPILYGALKLAAPQIAFLNRQAICFVAIVAVLTAMTLLRPLPQPVTLPVNEKMNLTPSRTARLCGLGVVLLTLALYVIFW